MVTYATYAAALLDPLFAGLTDPNAIKAAGDAQTVLSTSAGVLWRYNGVALMSSPQTAELLGATLAADGFPLAAQDYVATGIDLALPQSQAMLSMLAQQATAAAAAETESGNTAAAAVQTALAKECNDLKLIGITYGTFWQLWGLAEPTVATIEAAQATNAAKAMLDNFYWNTAQTMLAAGTTITNLKTAFAGA